MEEEEETFVYFFKMEEKETIAFFFLYFHFLFFKLTPNFIHKIILFLFSFADDKASIRDKMLLAATKATFKVCFEKKNKSLHFFYFQSEFGQSFIRHEFQIANRNDLQLDHFEKHYLNKETDSVPIEVIKHFIKIKIIFSRTRKNSNR